MAKLEYFGMHVSLMLLMGMYPLSKDSNLFKKIAYNLWRLLIVVSIICISTFSVVDIVLREKIVPTEIAANIVNIAIFFGGLIRVLYYYMKVDIIQKIYNIMKNSYVIDTDLGASDIGTGKKVDFLKKFDYFWRINVLLTVEFMVLVPLFLSEKRILPLPAWLPWNWKENTALYCFSVFYEALNNFFIAIIFPNADLMFISLTTLTGFQFEILAENYRSCMSTALLKSGVQPKEIQNFQKDLNSKITTNKFYEVFDGKIFKDHMENVFGDLVKRHQELLNISEELEDFFSPIMLPCISVMVLYTVFMAYCVVALDGDQGIGLFVQYIVSSLLQLLMFSFGGQVLTSSSEDMLDKIYEMPWYLLSKKQKLQLLFVQMKTIKSVETTAGKFVIISLRSFLVILKTVYSFFALLQQSTSSSKVGNHL